MQELSNKPVYTIGVASELLDLSPHSLRLYEKEGLILPHRTATNRRIYSDVELAKVKNIRKLIQESGLNFSAIRHILSSIPCWKFNNSDCSACAHFIDFLNMDQPCWINSENCKNKGELCRDCPVYQHSTGFCNIKEMISEETAVENKQ
ncbi:MerR family transcriptional regulator [Gemmatimonadota bacterium]